MSAAAAADPDQAIAEAYRRHVEIVGDHTRAALEDAGLDGLAVFAGRERMRFLDDRPHPFPPNPHFLWWAPLTHHPDCWIYFEPGSRPRLIFVQPEDYWHSPPRDPEGFWCDSFEIRVVRDARDARGELPERLSGVGVVGEPDLTPDWGFGAVNPPKLIDYLHWQRAKKSDYELHCMRRASRRAVAGHRAAERAFRDGRSEYEVNMAYLSAVEASDEEQPYHNIVALNEHAAVLHYQHRERQAPPHHRSLLIDAGASHSGYASDVTRTYAAEEGEFAALIAALDLRQQVLAGKARAGVGFAELHQEAHRGIAEVLAELEIARGSPEALVESGVTTTFLPHGLGHFLGLQVHDVGGHQAGPEGGTASPPEAHPHLRLTRTLEPGHVVTIEPGLYFIDSLLQRLRAGPHQNRVDWDAIERLRPFGGVRIEDDVAVTTGEPENLTRDAFAAG